jgi:hypothetical protein
MQEHRETLRALTAAEKKRAAMLRRGGLPSLDRREAAVLSVLSEAGLAHDGGVLVGTMAFAGYSGMLGALFAGATLKTQDIDIVSWPAIAVSLPAPVDLQEMLKKSGLRFLEVPTLNKKYAASSFLAREGIRVDILTPLVGRPRGNIPIPNLGGIGATPLPFLDFLVESPIECVLLAPSGGIAVTVPQPERFAVHKLVIAARRPASEAAKSRKDVAQSSELMAVLSEERPDELKETLKRALKKGGKFTRYLEKGLKMLPDPSVATAVMARR